jgi:hypothetical protein
MANTVVSVLIIPSMVTIMIPFVSNTTPIMVFFPMKLTHVWFFPQTSAHFQATGALPRK